MMLILVVSCNSWSINRNSNKCNWCWSTGVTATFTGDVSVRNLTGVAATFTGVLTYEDVTNVDSVGVVTARGGFEIGTILVWEAQSLQLVMQKLLAL